MHTEEFYVGLVSEHGNTFFACVNTIRCQMIVCSLCAACSPQKPRNLVFLANSTRVGL